MKEDFDQVTIFSENPDSSSFEYKGTLEKLQNKLLDFGLTSNQCKVYIFLGKYGSKTASEVCKALKLARTETYQLLTTLQNKGIVSATFKHPIIFSALPLGKTLHSMVNNEKEKIKTLETLELELKELWEKIPTFHKDSESKEDKFQILQGENQIHGKVNDMINNTKKEFLILGNEKDFLKFYHANSLATIGKSELEAKILTSSSDKTMYVFDEIQKSNIRKLPSNIQPNLCFLVKDNDELLFYIKNSGIKNEKLTAMWTTAESLIYSTKLLFKDIFYQSKNI